jgi:hypothetical protein
MIGFDDNQNKKVKKKDAKPLENFGRGDKIRERIKRKIGLVEP